MRPPYSRWNVAQLAQAAGLRLLSRLEFDKSRFPGYRHQTTDPQAKFFNACKSETLVLQPLNQ